MGVSVRYRTLAHANTQLCTNSITIRTEYGRIFSQSVNYLAIHGQLAGTVVDNVQQNITLFVSSLASRQDGASPSYEVRVLLAGWRAS